MLRQIGNCQICGKEAILDRVIYNYPIDCQCHNNKHIEILEHCGDCKPVEPKETKVTLSTEYLKTHMIINIDDYEHLLNCMCNQKFIHEQSGKMREENQKIIDDAYHKARHLLNDFVQLSPNIDNEQTIKKGYLLTKLETRLDNLQNNIDILESVLKMLSNITKISYHKEDAEKELQRELKQQQEILEAKINYIKRYNRLNRTEMVKFMYFKAEESKFSHNEMANIINNKIKDFDKYTLTFDGRYLFVTDILLKENETDFIFNCLDYKRDDTLNTEEYNRYLQGNILYWNGEEILLQGGNNE